MSAARWWPDRHGVVPWVILVGALGLPLIVVAFTWTWLQQTLGTLWACLAVIATAQAALGAAWWLRKRLSTISTSPIRFMDATIHHLLKIRSLRRLLRLVTHALVRAFGAAHATLFLEETRTKTYRLAATHGPGKPTAVQQLDDTSLLILWLLEHPKPLRASDCRSGPELLQPRDGKRNQASPQRRLHFILQNLNAALVVPSFRGKRLVGFVALGLRTTGRAYSDAEVAALSQLAGSCAVALENARSFEALEIEANKLSSTRTLLVEQQRLADAGKLAMGLAHEIKNPLTGIKTFTEFLSEKYDDRHFREEFMRVVPAEVARINRIVQSLSDFARPPLLKLKAVDMQQVLADTISLLSNECLRRNVQVTQQLDPDQIYLTADPGALKQAFLNLYLNALDAMEHGGTLSVHSQLEGTEGVIRISDTGTGISPEHIKTLFNPFFTTKQGGMGLGLAVVKQIVNQHLGVITVESNVGYGTTFEIRLPHAVRLKPTPGIQPPSYTATPAELPHRLAAPIRALVVEDEPKIQEVLRERLESLGARVRTVTSGEEALEVLAQEPQELVVVDLKLPNVHGVDVLKRVKLRYPTTAVVMITGVYDDEIDAYVRSLGALACLHKPLDLPRLQEVAYQVAARSCPPASA